MTHTPSPSNFLFGIVVLTAIALHAAVIFVAHGHKLAPSVMGGKAYMENQQVSSKEDDNALLRQEETRRKNEQLATLFQEMRVSSTEVETSPAAFFQHPAATSESAEIGLEDTAQVPSRDIDVLYASNNFWINEMIRATEMAQGQMEPLQEETELSTDSIKAGKAKGTGQGTAALNRSGMLEQGRNDTLLGSKPPFSSEFESPLKNSLYSAGLGGRLTRGIADKKGGFDNLGNIASSNDFTLDVQVAPRRKGPGFLFRIELIPKPDVKFRRINQNYFFLIDRSHSIRFARYELTRQAVSHALSLLHPGDTFNILIFDDHVVPFAPRNVPWTPDNVASAREFLAKQKYGGLFSSTDLYTSLGKIVPAAVAEKEVNTAILLSDGDTFLSSEKQRESIDKWTRQNTGKVSLYSVASGKGNNLALLDVLCFFNKGMLQYSALDQDIESQILSLMESLRNPIGKEMTMTAIRPSADIDIVLYPPNSSLPNLYEHSPFVVYGTINRLQDFHIFFQGKYYEKSLDIKHQVSFAHSKQSNAALLEQRLAIYQAYESYARFLRDGKKSHLTHAKELLQPHRLPMAFK